MKLICATCNRLKDEEEFDWWFRSIRVRKRECKECKSKYSSISLPLDNSKQHLIQHQSVYTETPWCSYSTCMLSEQPGKEISSNPKSEIDPDEPVVYQIRVKLGNYWPKRTY